MKTLLPILAICGISLVGILSCASVEDARSSISEPEAAELRDGTFIGSYFILPVNVKVRTTISSGRIVNIEILRHFNGQGSAAEAIVPRIIEKQSLKVDAISGATQSSITILKAVEASLYKSAEK